MNTNTLFDEKNRDLPTETASKAKSRAAAMGQALHDPMMGPCGAAPIERSKLC